MSSVEAALAEISSSILFQDDFPRWEQTTGEGTKTDERHVEAKRHEASLEANAKAGSDWHNLQNLVQTLGQAQYANAVPILSELWRTCSLMVVRTAVGHALFNIGSIEALAALQETLTDPDHFSRRMAIKAVLVSAPGEAFDRLSPLLDNHKRPYLANEVIWFLQRDLELPGWPPPGEPLVDRDTRWLRICAKLRHDFTCGFLAREILRDSPQDVRKMLLAEVKNEELAAGLHAPPRANVNGSLLRRYRNGQFEAVWQDIRLAGAIGGEFYDEVLEVAEATMIRVTENADMIAGVLRSQGWFAFQSEYTDLRTVPEERDLEVVTKLEDVTGERLPPTLKAFWRVVGGINWVWDYEASEARPDLGVALPMDEMDPLCVDPARTAMYSVEQWLEENNIGEEDADLAEPLVLELAADYYHKANISGGDSYSIFLPTKVADPIFEYEPHRLPFVDYLRLAFDWCGFPGLEKHRDRPEVVDLLERLGKNRLIPF